MNTLIEQLEDHMKRILFLALPYVLSACCFLAFTLIGSEVAPDGTLVEPFFLIPIGYACLALGIISTLLVGIRKWKLS